MGKFENVLIVSDMDGTFLGTGGVMVPRNAEKIKYFTKNGGLFTFATGRIYNTIHKKVPEAIELMSAPAILANGTYFYDFRTNERIGEQFMDVPAMRALLHYVKENYPRVEYRVATRMGQVTHDISGPRLSRECQKNNDGVFVIYDSIDDIPGDDWYKCVFRASSEDISRLRADVEPRYSEVFQFSLSDPEFFELQKKGTSKGKKLIELKERYSKAGRDVTVYACGDYENDYEMLLAADVAVCPTNALEKIKAIADISPCDNDEGLIAALIDIIEEKL